MIKFVVFDTYTSDGPEVYARAAVVIDKITSLVEVSGAVPFTFIYLTEPAGETDCNFIKVKGSLEETMLTIMAGDVEHEQRPVTEIPVGEKWAPINYREGD